MKKLLFSLTVTTFCLFLFGFTTATFKLDESLGQTLSARLSFISGQWQDMKSETDLSYEAIDSWLPDEGIRGKYAIASSVLSIKTMEGIMGASVYVSGPHTHEMDYNSRKTFGHYNPDFLANLQGILTIVLQNKTLVNATRGFYDQQLKKYLRTYALTYKEAFNNQRVADKYLMAIANYPDQGGDTYNTPGWLLQVEFNNLTSQLENQGYDPYEASVCPGFWVRRTVDGTGAQFYELLQLVLKAYDPGFSY